MPNPALRRTSRQHHIRPRDDTVRPLIGQTIQGGVSLVEVSPFIFISLHGKQCKFHQNLMKLKRLRVQPGVKPIGMI